MTALEAITHYERWPQKLREAHDVYMRALTEAGKDSPACAPDPEPRDLWGWDLTPVYDWKD